ncbi:YlzJ-like family protein [Vallitalea guaymasensis]|uniref:YlzJ-like family protein n=1 Tax=Vallitalea guaymasensis TaxID=1185412 RepID=A0A8J8SEF8_9FIRM|nr:YlzJ-like family protein [Vallitalea guaymasensis]QUH31837.1 YlzJ-like family protein [Vallitalea guaymasensis]
MYYSIIPYEELFPTTEDDFKYEEVTYEGNTVQVYKKDDKYIVKRVISTDLKVYLNKELSPGSELKM